MASKGLELPINVIVIVAIAVLVLVVAAALFSSQFGAGAGTIQMEQAYGKGCQTLRSAYSCDRTKIDDVEVKDYKAPGETTRLDVICGQKYPGVTGAELQDACLRGCGCPV
ncbi:MAG: hypothetical protein HYW26_03105 [Candidatus Aenigmarchaeota archaeon]|nr:hypothetical protein [Candidatus Aenigmarchaeota archaeon]